MSKSEDDKSQMIVGALTAVGVGAFAYQTATGPRLARKSQPVATSPTPAASQAAPRSAVEVAPSGEDNTVRNVLLGVMIAPCILLVGKLVSMEVESHKYKKDLQRQIDKYNNRVAGR